MANQPVSLSTAAALPAAAENTNSKKLSNNGEQSFLARQIAALRKRPYADLRAMWCRHFRYPAPKKLGRGQLELGIAWKLQARAHGGLSSASKRRLDDLAQTLATKSDLPQKQRTTLKPGARLLRSWDGKTHEVFVTDEGFVWRGKTWASLSIIAREITGTRWSGPRFFGLGIATNEGASPHA
jgi:hypothetical protein